MNAGFYGVAAMPFVFANNCRGFLAAPISEMDTTLTLQNATDFPSVSNGDFYVLTLVGGKPIETSWEIVKVTGKTGNVLTVQRGQEGTVARSWSLDSLVEMRLTASMASMFQAKPYDISGFYPGKPTGSSTLVMLPLPRAFYFDTNLMGSVARAAVPPSASAVTLIIRRNGTQIGTIVFSIGNSTGVFSMSDNNPLPAESILTITGNGSMDANFSDFSFTLKGYVKD